MAARASRGRRRCRPRTLCCRFQKVTRSPPELLEVRELTKRFDGFTAVNRVSFHVAEGEILGLIGPNGSGKSTTFNVVAGALEPTSGSVRFGGREIGGLPAHHVAHVGIARTYQIPRPFRKLSLLDNVALAAFYGANQKL